MSPGSLDELLVQLSGNEVDAERAFRACEPFLRKAVRRCIPPRLRARFDSSDVVQSVWADLMVGFRKAGWRFADADHLRAFLVKAARNRFIDRLRQHQPSLEREEAPGSAVLEVAAPGPRPSEVAQAEDLWARLLLLCPPEHRELLLLKRQGHSLAEIAARTGLHGDSVRRVLRTLARRLAFAGRPSP
jgi:RNA polymerase sigma-70 factor (ECF subfamily)